MVLAPLFAVVFLSVASEPNITWVASGQHDETAVAVSGYRAVVAAIRRVSPDEPAWIDVYVSDDMALTWSDPIRMPTTIAGTDLGYETDPALTVFDDGSFGLVFLGLQEWLTPQSTTNKELLVFTRSTDGHVWSPPQVLLTGEKGRFLVADRPFLSVDPLRGTAYLIFDTTASHPMVLSTSTDRGAHWSTAAPIGTDDMNLGQLTVLEDGTLVVTALAGSDTLVSTRSAFAGTWWSAPVTIATGYGPPVKTPVTKTASPPIPNLVSWGENVYCVYPTQYGVFFARSSDGGATWLPPVQLGGSDGDPALPTIAVDDVTGEVMIAWLDGRDDVNHDGTLRLYATRSTDSGKTLEPPRAFSSPFPAGGRMGDINGSASLRRDAVLTAFSTQDGHLAAARVEFEPAPKHRAAHR